MKRELGVFGVMVLGLLVGISATLSFAQQKQAAPDRATVERDRVKEVQTSSDRDFRFEMEMQGPEGMPPGFPGDSVFVATEMNFGGKVVKGAPYSAQAVTESVQTLSDGNRIVNKSTAVIYRDSEGRTRREQTFRTAANGGEPPQIIFINDPVAGTTYTLDPRTHVARKLPPMNFKFQLKVPPPGEGKGGVVGEAPSGDRIESARVGIERGEIERGQMGRAEMGIKALPPVADNLFVWGWHNEVSVQESLGKQNVEGVEAEGTRSKVTIPAGEIGNERPIEIINERWYAPELQTVVMTRHSDPRMGESTYRLTNIDRSEPVRSLFEVPPDYTINKSGRVVREGGPGIGTTTTMYRSADMVSGGVLNGKATSLPIPAYPAIARAANATGNVMVKVTIDEGGNVVAATAVSGHPLLQAASVEAARNAKFSPTKLSDQPVKVQGVLVYTFAGDPAQKENE